MRIYISLVAVNSLYRAASYEILKIFYPSSSKLYRYRETFLRTLHALQKRAHVAIYNSQYFVYSAFAVHASTQSGGGERI